MTYEKSSLACWKPDGTILHQQSEKNMRVSQDPTTMFPSVEVSWSTGTTPINMLGHAVLFKCLSSAKPQMRPFLLYISTPSISLQKLSNSTNWSCSIPSRFFSAGIGVPITGDRSIVLLFELRWRFPTTFNSLLMQLLLLNVQCDSLYLTDIWLFSLCTYFKCIFLSPKWQKYTNAETKPHQYSKVSHCPSDLEWLLHCLV